MRLTFALALITMGLVAPSVAEARPKSADDDALVVKLLAHADAISAILEKQVDHPKKAIVALDKYLKKRRKAMKDTVAQLIVVAGELDADARSDLRTQLLWAKPSARFLKALQAFEDKWGKDPAYAEKIESRLKELMTDGKKLLDALMQ